MGNLVDKNVIAVIVTYGDRIDYVKKVVDRLKKIKEITQTILVDNNSNQKMVSTDFLKVVSLEKNSGSANGYYLGLKNAVKNNPDFVWMLDDDNLPSENALEKLLNDYEKMEVKAAFCSYRLDRKELKEAGGQRYIPNSFFGFSLKSKIKRRMANKLKENNLLPCDTVPYGGLLLPIEYIKLIGYPNRDYVLYSDDNDYTYRLKKRGIQLFCDTKSVISDLESSWYRREKVPMFQGVFRTKMMRNALYTIRNRTYFELNNIVTSKFEYWLNVVVYLMYVFVFYMPKNKLGFLRFGSILKCIKMARIGQLGELDENC